MSRQHFHAVEFVLTIDAVLEAARVFKVTHHSSHVEDVDQIVEHNIAAPKSCISKGFRKGDGELTKAAARSER